jgi:NADPH-dependent glutamate synthase beta subunit-like oxidoreductase/NAD(P)H-flavin reductase
MRMNETSAASVSALAPLGIPGYAFADLHDPDRLASLYRRFCEDVEASDPSLWREWDGYRRTPDQPPAPIDLSRLLIAMAAHVSRFLTRLFDIESEASALVMATRAEDELFRFKVEFVRRRVLSAVKAGAVPRSEADEITVERLIRQVKGFEGFEGFAAFERDPSNQRELASALELALARSGCVLLDREKTDREAVRGEIEALKRWCASRLHQPVYRDWVLFRLPEKLDYWRLVEVQRPDARRRESMRGPDHRLRRRDGFKLTDPRMRTRDVLGEIDYCVLCHERDKDSCSKGLFEKNGRTSVNPLGIELSGCPLDEKISEMHLLRKAGDALGALALVMLDNPMCAGTGHRICNDCMKSCIYQKQDPVNIPQIETAVLTDVLKLPWGVEIFGLLTRWNPLNVRRPHALPYNGKTVLVVGLGPAGYTLAHYLVNEGFGVVGVDGLKIEPLPRELVGGEGEAPRPVREWNVIYRQLDDRILEGFGGVSEYGITVRWDKNFLTLLHLTLARRRGLRMYGGVRFGGTLPLEDAWMYGFDHVAIAAGAGRPTIIDMKNNLARGIRKASDFLMALQLTGAFKREALPNLQVRLPAVVIGGGLTAIDTATELMAYYPLQVEKVLHRYEALAAENGEAKVRAYYDEEELEILDEYCRHGRAIRDERSRAGRAGEAPDFIPLVRSWGGVTIAYRKRLVDSPAYRLNHEEVIKALEEGVAFDEGLDPLEAAIDERGAVKAVAFKRDTETSTLVLPARTVLVAAGTTPNITCEKEAPNTFQLDARRKFFQPHRAEPNGDGTFRLVPDAGGFFTSYNNGGRLVTYYGDNHPQYAGNVVKAMASAKRGYAKIAALFADELARLDPARQPSRDRAWGRLLARLDEDLTARVEDVVRLTPTIVEVIVKAPAAARHFRPGQFYRLQNYETLARRVRVERGRPGAPGASSAGRDRRSGTSAEVSQPIREGRVEREEPAKTAAIDAFGGPIPLLMEGIALTGAWVDKEKGLLSLIALELGVSSRLVAYLQKGERVVVMGPTGAPTEIPENHNVVLLGGGLGNAVLFSIARAMRERGNTVLYFAGYKQGEDLFKREEIEAGTDQVIWSTDGGEAIPPRRPQDAHFRGNIVQAMLAYQSGELGTRLVPLEAADRIIAIGSDRMMAAVKAARHGVLAPHLKPDHVGIASINSPMQCMMKEVCAQCLQKHVDPATRRETIIFSCFNQDQEMDRVDFPTLAARLRQNTVQEKLSNLWLDHLLAHDPQLHV